MSQKKEKGDKPFFSRKEVHYHFRLGPLDESTVFLIKIGLTMLNVLILLIWGKIVYDALVRRPMDIVVVVSTTIAFLCILWNSLRFLLRKSDDQS